MRISYIEKENVIARRDKEHWPNSGDRVQLRIKENRSLKIRRYKVTSVLFVDTEYPETVEIQVEEVGEN